MNGEKYDGLKYRLLKNPIFIQKYVKNDPDCDYEKYLREMVNASKFFRKLANQKEYIAPPREDDSECDAISDSYKIDFKLAVSSSQAEGNRMLSNRMILLCPGLVAETKPKVEGRSAEILLNFALCQYTRLEELISLNERVVDPIPLKKRNTDNAEVLRDHDVKDFLSNLRKDKNLLYLFPVEFFFDNDEHIMGEGIDIIAEALNDYFSLSFSIREYYGIKKDTFICSIYRNYFIVFQYFERGLVYVDRIPTDDCETFTRLKQRYDKGELD